MKNERRHDEAGIAIGPILFAVAILAVLAGAIAAGSGGFTASTTTETARINAATLIQQASNLKMASDRLLVNGKVVPATVGSPSGVEIDVSTDCSANSSDNANGDDACLYSPSGGGVSQQTPPSKALAHAASVWNVIATPIPGVGTGSNDLVAVIQVTQPVCQQIEKSLYNTTTITVTGVPSVLTASMGVRKVTGLFVSGSNGRASDCVETSGMNYIYYHTVVAQ